MFLESTLLHDYPILQKVLKQLKNKNINTPNNCTCRNVNGSGRQTFKNINYINFQTRQQLLVNMFIYSFVLENFTSFQETSVQIFSVFLIFQICLLDLHGREHKVLSPLKLKMLFIRSSFHAKKIGTKWSPSKVSFTTMPLVGKPNYQLLTLVKQDSVAFLCTGQQGTNPTNSLESW